LHGQYLAEINKSGDGYDEIYQISLQCLEILSLVFLWEYIANLVRDSVCQVSTQNPTTQPIQGNEGNDEIVRARRIGQYGLLMQHWNCWGELGNDEVPKADNNPQGPSSQLPAWQEKHQPKHQLDPDRGC